MGILVKRRKTLIVPPLPSWCSDVYSYSYSYRGSSSCSSPSLRTGPRTRTRARARAERGRRCTPLPGMCPAVLLTCSRQEKNLALRVLTTVSCLPALSCARTRRAAVRLEAGGAGTSLSWSPSWSTWRTKQSTPRPLDPPLATRPPPRLDPRPGQGLPRMEAELAARRRPPCRAATLYSTCRR